MRRRFLPPILTLVLLLTFLPGALAIQTPGATTDSAWEAADVQTLESGEDEYVALSPDGARIAGVGAEGGLCVWQVADMASACAEDVGAIRAESIAWSPDGSAVAFSLDHVLLLVESDIFVYEVADGALHNLTDDGAEGPAVNTEPGVFVDGVPAWSPDSQELAFARSQPSDETFGTVIMRIDRSGGEPSRVHRLPLETPYGIFMPMHWLPDASLLYTQVSLDGTDPGDGVWRVGLDGGDARRLLPGARGTEIAGPMLMDVSPESGLALVYAAFLEQESQFEAPEESQVWLLDIETGEVTPVPNLPPTDGEDPAMAGRAQLAAFSPDGSAFMGVYSSVMEGTILAVTEVASDEATVVASDVPARAGRIPPTWAGDQFFLPERDQATLVTLVGPAGAGATPPVASPVASPAASDAGWRIAGTRELDIDARYVTMSPDGAQLAGVNGDSEFCVWVTETLVSTCVEERLPIREETITWSPDGTAVAFALDTIIRLYESDIYVYEVQQGRLTNLTDDGVEGGLLDTLDSDPPADDVPAWSPDSQELVFVRSFRGDDAPGTTTIMRIDRAGGEPVEIVALDVEEPLAVWSPMHWLPDGTLVYSQLSMQTEDTRNGIWAVDVDGGTPRQIAPGAEGTDIPAPVLVDVDASGGQAIVLAWLLAGQRGLGADQPLYWLVDLETGDREPLPALPDDGSGPPVILEASYSPDGATVLLLTLGEAGVTLMTLDPATLAITPVTGEPIEAALRPEATLDWVSNDSVALPAPRGAIIIVALEPFGAAAAASPEATPVATTAGTAGGWRIVEERELPIETRYASLSPDGEWIAGLSGPDQTFCVWDVETLTPACVDERLPIREETITWSPDSTAVAFSLDAFIRFFDSDIYTYEMDTGELVNLTDDGVDGDVFDAVDADAPVDDVPAWSPDGQRIAFARSYANLDDEPGATSIMVIDRNGGEPVELLPLDVDEPYAVWMPMQWLPDGTLLYSQIVRDLEIPYNGVWKVGVDDGADPLQLVPGGEESDVPGPRISDATDDRAIVYSYWLTGQFGFDHDQPLFWQVDVATGERVPLAVPGGDAWIIDAGYSPDGSAALLVSVAPDEGARRLMLLDVASGEIVPLDTAPRETPFATGPPQWAANDTVLLQTPLGPVLLTLEPGS